MSQEEVLTGKAKKAKRSEERHKKNKKRKQDDVADVDNSLPAGLDEIESENLEVVEKKSSNKRKRSGDEAETDAVEAKPSEAATSTEAAKPKKRRKNKTPAAAPATETKDGAEPTASVEDSAPSKQRFIVFIGNLPFTATTEQITSHFSSITPTSIRHLTEPGNSKKSKGYAFLEFANYDRMKTCLKLYHHSIFDSGVGGEKGKRRINVELTAGGGGAGKERKEKLKVKNERLEGERQRRAEAAAKLEERKGKKGKGGKAGAGEKEVDVPVEAPMETEGMHPARLAMMQKGR